MSSYLTENKEQIKIMKDAYLNARQVAKEIGCGCKVSDVCLIAMYGMLNKIEEKLCNPELTLNSKEKD